MAAYPVKPGTVVQLPKRPADYYWKRSAHRHPQITPEMQIEQLKRKNRRLWSCLITFFILMVLLCTAVYYQYRRSKLPAMGQNYSTVIVPTEG